MIKDLNLSNSILTWDAINTRAATLKAVTEADADFLACLKSNQGYLYEEICDSFTFADADRYLGEVLSSKRVSSDYGRIEEKEIHGKKVFMVNGDLLIATFDTDVNESTITEIAKLRPVYFVMRDASAENDNVLDNFEQIFKYYSPDTIRRIL